MKLFLKIFILCTALTYMLIFVGALVRVSGSGLGCPEWPKCYGEFYPPLTSLEMEKRLFEEHSTGTKLTEKEAGELAQAFDVRNYNVLKAWIEYVNRLCGVILGLFMILAVILALLKARNHRDILTLTIVCFLLTVANGLIGSKVVTSELNSLIISIHMGLALIQVSIMIYVCIKSWFIVNKIEFENNETTASLKKFAFGLWLLTLVQICFGAVVRSRIEFINKTQPLLNDAEMFPEIGAIKFVHIGLGALIALGTCVLLIKVSKNVEKLYPGIVKAVNFAFLLVVVETAGGLLYKHLGMEAILQLYHMWFGSIYIGLLFYIFTAMTVKADSQFKQSKIIRRVLIIVIFTLSGFGYLTIKASKESEQVPMVAGPLAKMPLFKLTEKDGTEFSNKDIAGKVTIINFMFTTCKDVCPFALTTISKLYKKYDGEERIQFLSFSVDPKNDTVEAIKEYAAKMGITNRQWAICRDDNIDMIKAIANSLLVSSDFPENHSSRIILIDSNGIIRDYYNYNNSDSILVLQKNIEKLIREMPNGP
ncbi:MAG: COX15/CtaA family protein [Lentisphaeria bacterium]|nr:COX15/CtaA family protein [Lentisphaeria bacterium]NQZ69438.1 COX15/CtaA family protein [Lentisphaeria bacterium]